MTVTAKRPDRPDYGLDAPGVVRNLFLIGAAMLLLGAFTRERGIPLPGGNTLRIGGALFYTGLAMSLEAWLMVWSSYTGKFRERDRLLDGLELKGDERVLDVGCGRGLLLVGAAKRLPNGKAVGIDLWSQADQMRNTQEATLRNAALEGVAERIEVRTGNMMELPFADGEFDVVVASLSIHNISSRDGRRTAIAEIARVLKPGGRASLLDFRCTEQYAEDLRAKGMGEVAVSGMHFNIFPPVKIVTARKP